MTEARLMRSSMLRAALRPMTHILIGTNKPLHSGARLDTRSNRSARRTSSVNRLINGLRVSRMEITRSIAKHFPPANEIHAGAVSPPTTETFTTAHAHNTTNHIWIASDATSNIEKCNSIDFVSKFKYFGIVCEMNDVLNAPRRPTGPSHFLEHSLEAFCLRFKFIYFCKQPERTIGQ